MTAPAHPRHVAVIGGGIAGLAAAYFLRESGATVTVFEGSPRLGGKLTVSEVAGLAVDAGAEALLTRRPEGTGLIRAVGLGDQLVPAGTTSARIWSRGAFHELPARQFMGVPADVATLDRSGVVSPAGLARARQDAELPATPLDGDVPVAAHVAARFGQEVVDRLVDPLLGGVYAGRSEELSLTATMPALATAARRHRSLAEAAASLLPAQPPSGAAREPVFAALAGGLGTLPAAVAGASGATVRTGAMVRELTRTPSGWRLVIGPASAPHTAEADAVIVAVPAGPAGRLLAGPAREAATALAEISYASMAIVTLAYPRPAFPAPLAGSGYLVPAVDGQAVKGVTFSTVKWPHLSPDGGPHIIRCSIGRIGEDAILQRDDAELAELAAGELAAATGVAGGPRAARVTRWGGALPQYTVGHTARVARIKAAIAAEPGLAVCGAAYDGIGIPACVATAQAAAGQVLEHLAELAAGLTAAGGHGCGGRGDGGE
ncbi:MAG TPA: protoporphyrinogen oxidase [Streptosporangiaceae bacterium]|jgi:oxygen-dependent protoporphyrinogen oxidase|nr:protoporphyrinogen oxidase [Streptosporangiaceae bacterium]